jgi:hypothetical protein
MTGDLFSDNPSSGPFRIISFRAALHSPEPAKIREEFNVVVRT